MICPQRARSSSSAGRVQESELRNHPKRHLRLPRKFAHLLNEVGRGVSQEFRSFVDVSHSIGFETHEPGTHCIGGYRIVCKDNTAKPSGRPVQWAVALHAHNGIRDHEMDGNCGAQIEDRFLDAMPMEDILRPAVLVPGNHPEHVLHAERNPGPVVCFYLGHGNQKIRAEYRPREPEPLEAAVFCRQID